LFHNFKGLLILKISHTNTEVIQLFEHFFDSLSEFAIVFSSICKRYDEMANRVSEVPDNTVSLVETQEYLKQVS